MKPTARILLAEDDLVISSLIVNILGDEGHRVIACADGQSTWAHLEQDATFDLILLDRMMPGMDGLSILRAIKSDLRFEHIPVIMETGLSDHASVREGLDAGAYYYLTKPIQPMVLVGVVRAALEQITQFRTLQESVRIAERTAESLREGVFQFRTLEEGRHLANYLARACPDPGRAIHGLLELVINAVEHGNLGLSYADKSALLLEERWEQEVERRLALPEYRERLVELRFKREADGIHFTLSDQGDGFDWRGYLDFSPERAFDLHGRGIAMARKLSFDSVEYQGNGNTVLACIRTPEATDGEKRPPLAD